MVVKINHKTLTNRQGKFLFYFNFSFQNTRFRLLPANPNVPKIAEKK